MDSKILFEKDEIRIMIPHVVHNAVLDFKGPLSDLVFRGKMFLVSWIYDGAGHWWDVNLRYQYHFTRRLIST